MKRIIKGKVKRKKFVWALLALCLFCLGLLQGKVIGGQDAFTPVTSDCILILGHALEDGNAPGEWLAARLEVGLGLYQQGYGDTIVVSGGKGVADNVSVASSMAQWLVAKGVDPAHIIAEEESRDTYENMAFTNELLAQNALTSVVVVTSDFHMYRAMLLGQQVLGNVSGAGAPVPLSLGKVAATIKEPFSIIKAECQVVWHRVIDQ